MVLIAVTMLAGCATTQPPARAPAPWYKTPGITAAAFETMYKQCAYEAEKALAAADPRTATAYARSRIHDLCLDARGATFVGTVTMPKEQLAPIHAACRADAIAAVAERPPSHARDVVREDLEIACMRNRGVRFEPRPVS